MNTWARGVAGLVVSSVGLMGMSGIVLARSAIAKPIVEVTAAEEDLRERVQSALRSDPYLFDKYINVRIQDGRIVLSGFVYDAWDLRSALHIARSAAGLLPVVDDVEIKTAGLR